MKTNLFFILITLFCFQISLGQTTNRYHRLKALGTSLSSSEINSFCSGSTFQSRPTAHWNVISVNPLQVGKIYLFYHYERERNEYYYVEQYFNYATGDDGQTIFENDINPPVQVSCPEPDSDGDGVPNSQDNCPNQAGPASNNGCPLPELSFVLNGSIINSNCLSCDIVFSQIGTNRHFVNNNGVANVDILVENSGGSTSSATTVGVYVSSNSTFESDSDSLFTTFPLGAISKNNTKFASGGLFWSDFDNDNISGSFWLIFRIDDNESNNELDEDNNIHAIRFRVN